MSNLLRETNEILKKHNKDWKDVKWVGCYEFQMTIIVFKELANNHYDSGFGSQEVATDLLVVGDDWWLERAEYDGAENWSFKTLPKEPAIYRPDIKKIMGGSWETLKELNDEKGGKYCG